MLSHTVIRELQAEPFRGAVMGIASRAIALGTAEYMSSVTPSALFHVQNPCGEFIATYRDGAELVVA